MRHSGHTGETPRVCCNNPWKPSSFALPAQRQIDLKEFKDSMTLATRLATFCFKPCLFNFMVKLSLHLAINKNRYKEGKKGKKNLNKTLYWNVLQFP